jgi:uncharacterized protein (TIGR02611 family)
MPGDPERQPTFAARLDERKRRHRERSRLYRILFAASGIAVFVVGIVMLVLPGPGLLVSATGLAMLALEFVWAEQLLLRLTTKLQRARRRATWRKGN